MAAMTEEIDLTASGWTLLADGDAGDTNALMKLSKGDKALVRLGTAEPAPSVLAGIPLVRSDGALVLRLAAGVKVYGRATAAGTALVCAAWGPTGA